MTSSCVEQSTATHSQGRTYRIVWRWHFYAGLIVAPFLLVLSVTGAIYLFNDELNDALMPALHFVPPVAQPLPPSRLINAATAAVPGTPTQIDLPAAPNRPAKVHISSLSGEVRQVMVDPGSARVLGSFVYAQTLVGTADLTHGSLMLGNFGSAVMELAACWVLVLIGTGLFLWWPRNGASLDGVMWPRLALRGRVFWRDLHAVTGAWVLALIAFLIVTGLPWALVQGPLVRSAVAVLGIGNEVNRPDYRAPESQTTGDRLGKVAWSQQAVPMPASNVHVGHHGPSIDPIGADDGAVSGADEIPSLATQAGILPGYRLYLPTGPTGVYSVVALPDQPEGQRTLYFDRWTKRLIAENGWQHYGVGAKAIELGVQIHMGRYFGRANQLFMLVACVGIIVLVVSGVIMWWRRRPVGRLGAPPSVPNSRVKAMIVLLAVAGVLLPVFGASLVVLALLDKALVAIRSASTA